MRAVCLLTSVFFFVTPDFSPSAPELECVFSKEGAPPVIDWGDVLVEMVPTTKVELEG